MRVSGIGLLLFLPLILLRCVGLSRRASPIAVAASIKRSGDDLSLSEYLSVAI